VAESRFTKVGSDLRIQWIEELVSSISVMTLWGKWGEERKTKNMQKQFLKLHFKMPFNKQLC